MAAHALHGARTAQDVAAGVGVDLASVRLHTGQWAADSARAERARAYTVGSDIVFGDRQFAPERPDGARLLAHELAHVAQQRRTGEARIQRQSADVTFPDQKISGALRPIDTNVSGLGALATPAGPGLAVGRTDATATASALPLPFKGSGWESGEILTTLGQFDDLPGTDSDAVRCVQAVAMASHIVDGPEAVKQYINAVLLDAALSRPRAARENKAREVLEYFVARLDNRTATYGDVSWAQEALHDLFYGDAVGTPESDIPSFLAKIGGPDRTFQSMDVWCENPLDVVAQAKLLKPGEQLVIVPTTVVFNQALDLAAPDPNSPAVNETDVTLPDGTQAHVRRFDASTRPPATAINAARDHSSGHQMLIIRDSTTKELRVYEPEAVDSGDHFLEMDTAGQNFEPDFRDIPSAQIYGYVHVIGKITPTTPPPKMFEHYRPSWL